MNISDFSSLVIIFLYTFGAICVLRGILKKDMQLQKIAFYCTAFGLCIHTILLFNNVYSEGWNMLSKGSLLQLLAWFVLAVYLASWRKLKTSFLGLTAAPLALFLYLISFKFESVATTMPEYLSGLFFTLHIATLFITYALLSIGFGAAALFLYAEKKIKNKEKLALFALELPSLSVLDKVNNFAVLAGFPLYSLGIFSGFTWARLAFGQSLSWDPKEIVSLIVWFVYAILFHHRIVLGWRGRKAAIIFIIIFAVSLFSLIGINFFIPSHHSFQPALS